MSTLPRPRSDARPAAAASRSFGSVQSQLGSVRGRFVAGLRLIALVLLPGLLAAGAPAQSLELVRCQFTGALIERCCCTAADVADDTSVASYAPDDCCELERVEASLPTGVTSPSELSAAGCVLTRVSVVLTPRALRASRLVATRAEARDREPQRSRAGPSLIIVQRRLLI